VQKFQNPALNRFAAPFIGSIIDARRAGKYDANRAVPSRMTATATITEKPIPETP